MNGAVPKDRPYRATGAPHKLLVLQQEADRSVQVEVDLDANRISVWRFCDGGRYARHDELELPVMDGWRQSE